MNEKLKELAKQATNYAKDICIHDPDAVWYEVRDAKFAELVRQDEREACAKLCNDLADLNDWADSYANKCAAVIRARKTE
jgi:hypothetical protein